MFDKLTKKTIYIIIAVAVAASLVVEILFAHPHGHAIWDTVPGADIIIAFVGCWALILFSKKILAPLVQRDEDYYDKEDDEWLIVGYGFEEYRQKLSPMRSIDHAGEVAEYMLVLSLNDLGESFLRVNEFVSQTQVYAGTRPKGEQDQ